MTGLRFLVGAETFFATVSRRALGLSQPLFNGYWGLFPRRESGRGVKLTIHLHLVPRLRIRGVILPLPEYTFMVWCPV